MVVVAVVVVYSLQNLDESCTIAPRDSDLNLPLHRLGGTDVAPPASASPKDPTIA
jgi:hypothetical protein